MTTPLRLLIIEDSEDDALLIVRDLRRAGYEPGGAAQGISKTSRTFRATASVVNGLGR
jgi:hypothetical protein